MDHQRGHTTRPLETFAYTGQTLMITLYTMTACIAFISNMITIVVLAKGKRCAREVGKFLMNLSVSDMAMALFTIPFTYTNYMFGRWVFWPFMCSLVNMAQLTTITVSVYTLVAIAIDRYLAIMHPLHSSWFKTHRALILVLIWCMGLIFGASQLYVSETSTFVHMDQVYTSCGERWLPETMEGQLYTLFIFVSTFALPMALMCVIYSSMGVRLLQYRAPGQQQNQELLSTSSASASSLSMRKFIKFSKNHHNHKVNNANNDMNEHTKKINSQEHSRYTFLNNNNNNNNDHNCTTTGLLRVHNRSKWRSSGGTGGGGGSGGGGAVFTRKFFTKATSKKATANGNGQQQQPPKCALHSQSTATTMTTTTTMTPTKTAAAVTTTRVTPTNCTLTMMNISKAENEQNGNAVVPPTTTPTTQSCDIFVEQQNHSNNNNKENEQTNTIFCSPSSQPISDLVVKPLLPPLSPLPSSSTIQHQHQQKQQSPSSRTTTTKIDNHRKKLPPRRQKSCAAIGEIDCSDCRRQCLFQHQHQQQKDGNKPIKISKSTSQPNIAEPTAQHRTTLFSNKANNNNNNNRHSSTNSSIHHKSLQMMSIRRNKVLRMLITIIGVFTICWLPIQIFTMTIYFKPNFLNVESDAKYYTFVSTYFICHWISMAHSFMNPIIYSFMSKNFKEDLHLIFTKWWNVYILRRDFRASCSSSHAAAYYYHYHHHHHHPHHPHQHSSPGLRSSSRLGVGGGGGGGGDATKRHHSYYQPNNGCYIPPSPSPSPSPSPPPPPLPPTSHRSVRHSPPSQLSSSPLTYVSDSGGGGGNCRSTTRVQFESADAAQIDDQVNITTTTTTSQQHQKQQIKMSLSSSSSSSSSSEEMLAMETTIVTLPSNLQQQHPTPNIETVVDM